MDEWLCPENAFLLKKNFEIIQKDLDGMKKKPIFVRF